MTEVEHILRPCLPWRVEERVTECGRQAAVDALVEAHQDEFDSYVEGVLVAPSLATARAKRARGRR